MVNCPRCRRANSPENVETASGLHATTEDIARPVFPVTETFTCAECRSTYRADWEHEFDEPAVVALDESGVEWSVSTGGGQVLWKGWRRGAAIRWAGDVLLGAAHASRGLYALTVTGTDLDPDRDDDGVIESITLTVTAKAARVGS